MVTLNDKISLIINVDNLFGSNNPKVQNMITGDVFMIDELYKNSLNFIKEKSWYKFKHLISMEIMTLKEWMDWYRCDINNPKDVIIFLRYGINALI